MRLSRLAWGALWAGALALGLQAKEPNPLDRVKPVPANEPIPVMDFFRPPVLLRPILNPAGTHFVALASTGADRVDAIVYELATGKIERLTGGTDADVEGCRWLDDRHFLFQLTTGKMYPEGLYVGELGKLQRTIQIQRHDYVDLVGVPNDQPLKPVVWLHGNEFYSDLEGCVLQLDASGRQDMKDRGQGFARVAEDLPMLREQFPVEFIADAQGHLAFGITSKDNVTKLHRFEAGKWVACPFDVNDLSIISAGEKEGELFVLGPREEGKPRALQTFDAKTGQLGSVIYRDEAYDLDPVRLYRAPDGKLLGLQFTQKLPKDVWFDPAMIEIQAAIEKALPGLAITLMGSDRDRKHFMFVARSDVAPPVYYRYDVDAHAIGKVTSVAPWIDPQRMSRMRGITFKTRDGVSLDAYITLPIGASKDHPVPLVVLSHGGPWARDSWGWQEEVQFLASRGYAVLQTNYRGSLGYQWRVPLEDTYAFRKMHDDVTDAVKAALKTGVIDRDRVAIMGGSFGGYLAICGAAYEPELYRCAVTIAGVFDWREYVKAQRRYRQVSPLYGNIVRQLGDPEKDRQKFDEMSPLNHVDQIKIPIYVAHGFDDSVVPVEQSKSLISELKKNGIPYEKQIEWNEPHGFRHLEHQVALYTAIEGFLKKNLAPR